MQRLRLHHEGQPAADGRVRLRPKPGDQRLRTEAQVDEDVAADRLDHFDLGVETGLPLPGHPDPFRSDADGNRLSEPGVGHIGAGQCDTQAVTEVQLEAIDRWRKEIRSVAMEEMAHLASVNNLLMSIGSPPHFRRQNFPVPAGYHPASLVVRLAPLTASRSMG